MKQNWVIKLPIESSSSLGELRDLSDLQVATDENHLWLQGHQMNDGLSQLLRALPGGERFLLLADQQLVPHEGQVPTKMLPDITWQPIQTFYTIELELASMGGIPPEKVSLRMLRSQGSQLANILLTTLSSLEKYIDNAPQIRLDPLLFVVDAQQRVILKGLPLPPIAGQFYSEVEGIAVQAGWEWSPAVDAKVLNKLFELQSGDIMLLSGDGSREKMTSDQFVKLTRSAVRQTMLQFTNSNHI